MIFVQRGVSFWHIGMIFYDNSSSIGTLLKRNEMIGVHTYQGNRFGCQYNAHELNTEKNDYIQ
jgi:hypothetical protein